jgi:hypothetical protein
MAVSDILGSDHSAPGESALTGTANGDSAGQGIGHLRPLLLTLGPVTQPRGGIQARARLTAEIFADLGIPMTIVSTKEPSDVQTVDWANSLHVARKPLHQDFSTELVRLVRAAASGCNVMMFNNGTLMPTVASAMAGLKMPIIWDTNECQSLHHSKLPSTVSNRLMQGAWFTLERWAAHRCTTAISIGEVEASAWTRAHPVLKRKLAVVDHAALVTPKDPVIARAGLVSELGRGQDGPIMVFLGTLTAKQNAGAAQWILRELVNHLPAEATVVLVGPASEGLTSTGGRGAVVVGLGAVDDVDSVVAAADLCLAPLATGAGVKTKVLHYLAHGKRVAGTPTAFEGLETAPATYSATFDELPNLIEQLCAEVEDPDIAVKRAEDQQAWLDQHHGRTHIAEQWRRVLECLPS